MLKLTSNAGQCRAGGKSKQQTRLCRNAFNRLNTIQSLGIMAVCMFPTGRLLNIASLDDNRADEGVVEPSPFCLLKSTTTVMANRGLQAIDRQPTPSVSTN
ncbi:hypothetical protein T4E_5705 [Trichinella pseudospiralis]|uniref:Uncharacterized protein n=1 Tax=Trichinella pseudospiralis TaxID=6337 RepID=A0A0V0XNM1_TRIPS|nr:hypothetical protein T4E_5705 [Trichinella pseudospiralis]